MRGGVFLDSNLLLLLVIGTMDRGLIRKFKRTQGFALTQFDSLVDLISRSGQVYTTPHALTEVSSLANALHESQKQDFSSTFAAIIAALSEHFTPALQLSRDALFRFGIADTSILHLPGQVLVLTEDGRFVSHMRSRGLAALDLRTAITLVDQS